MYGNISPKMPIGLAMAFSHDKNAFYKFLNMSDNEQDEFIEKANKSKNIVEIQRMVNSMSKQADNVEKRNIT